MIDRIAKGQAEFDGRPWLSMSKTERERYRSRARLALTEMRQQTREMDSAGYDAYPTSVIRTGVDHLDIYRAMIDAALNSTCEAK